jgi:hypothetical protein
MLQIFFRNIEVAREHREAMADDLPAPVAMVGCARASRSSSSRRRVVGGGGAMDGSREGEERKEREG